MNVERDEYGNEVARRIGGGSARCPVHEEVRFFDMSSDLWRCPVTKEAICEHDTSLSDRERRWLAQMEADRTLKGGSQ